MPEKNIPSRDNVLDGSCNIVGLKYQDSEQIPQELVRCGTICVCSKGEVHCEDRCPPVPDIPPPHMPCPPAMAYPGYLPGIKYYTHYYKYAIILEYSCIYLIRR